METVSFIWGILFRGKGSKKLKLYPQCVNKKYVGKAVSC